MNLPNKLTTFRVILIPFFVFFMLAPNMTGINHYIAAAIFIVASLTDLLDGKIARKYNLVTNFGKFMDPPAKHGHAFDFKYLNFLSWQQNVFKESYQ